MAKPEFAPEANVFFQISISKIFGKQIYNYSKYDSMVSRMLKLHENKMNSCNIHLICWKIIINNVNNEDKELITRTSIQEGLQSRWIFFLNKLKLYQNLN